MALNKELILDVVYPVGAIYMSVNSTNPSTLFGGTWQQLKDRFLLGAGDTYSNGATGGEATHTLTVQEMPSHNHVRNDQVASADTSGTVRLAASGGTGSNINLTDVIKYAGGSQAHNNMPPYLVVYMWKRTS